MNTKQFLTTLIAVCVLGGAAVGTGWYVAQENNLLSRGLAAVAGGVNTGTTQGQTTGGTSGGFAPTKTVVPSISTDTGVEPGQNPPVLPPPPPTTTPVTQTTQTPTPTASPAQAPVTPGAPTLPPTVSTPSVYRAPAQTGRVVGGASVLGLKYRDSGSAVSRLQRCLVNAGTLDSSKMSGVFDKATRNALFLYQNGNRVPRTGVVDDKTGALMTSQNVCSQKVSLPEEPRPLPALLQQS